MGNTGIYASFPSAALGGVSGITPFSLLTAAVNAALLGTGYTPSQTSHQKWSDISGSEVTGTNYSAGGQALTSKALTTTSLTTTFTAANVTWASSTISSARYAALYQNTGTGSTSALIALFDFGSAQSSSANNFVIAWNASGILSLPVAAFS